MAAAVDVMGAAMESLRQLAPGQAALGAILVACAPAICVGALAIAQAGFSEAATFGFVSGVAWMGFAYFMQSYRSSCRRRKAAAVAATANLDIQKVKKIFENGDKSPIPPWIVFSDFQKVNWINNQIKEVWPYLNKATSQMITETLSNVLAAYKVGVIKRIGVKSITLGNVGPRITGVRTYKSGEDEVSLEAELDWMNARDQVIVIEAETTVLASLSVKVSDIQFGGRIKVIFKPLTNQLPGFGAILFCFTEQPKIEFDIGILGGDITSIPGIDGMIDNIIRTSLNDMLVWPARMVIPVATGDFSYLQMHPVGYLDIVLIEAKDVPKTDVVGKADSFVFLYVHQKEGAIKRSSVKKNEQNPVWNESFFIEVEEPKWQDLTVRLMDDETVEKAEYIGSRKYPISKLEPNKPKELWLDLVEDPSEPHEGQKRGCIHLFVTFRPYTSKEDEENSPVRRAQRADSSSDSDGDGIPYEEAKQGHIGPEFSTHAKADSAEKKKRVSGLVKKVTQKATCGVVAERTPREEPAEVEFDGPVEMEVVEGGSAEEGHAGKVSGTGGAGF